ncbi:MAG: phosphoribosyl-ATP diphosphatase, partial [Pseudomonadota bacterium]
MASLETLAELARTIEARKASTADASYTKSLLESGTNRCAKKFGEEAVEFALAVANQSDDDVTSEAADVLYHLLVALAARGLLGMTRLVETLFKLAKNVVQR